MRLADLLDAGIRPHPEKNNDPAGVEITGLSADTRTLVAGGLFVALEGTQEDGLRYLPAALEKGASALLLREGRPLPPDLDIPVLVTDEPRLALAKLAARLYPGMPGTIAAITGTNGKTSVATVLRQIWSGLGLRAASMGTLGVVTPDGPMPLAHTTPDPVRLHQILKALHDTGTNHLVLEASSHGLAQERLAEVRVTAAGFTNLTRDHLDYHGTMEAYRAAKARLFSERLVPEGTAVINRAGEGADFFVDVARAAGRAVMTVGTPTADLALRSVRPVSRGLDVAFAHENRAYTGLLPLYGPFQAENVVVALGLAVALGADFEAAAALTMTLRGAAGRLEQIGLATRDAPVFVDYAHTPDALARVLSALRPHARGRLHVVFGCGGDRDRGKRPQMGEVAARRADRIIVTDDNPRTEDPTAIRAEILAACPQAEEIGERAQAIERALDGMAPGDVLVVAGKGHETGQIVGDTVVPFNDADEIRRLLGRQGRAHD